MEHQGKPYLNRRFETLLSVDYGKDKLNLYSSDVAPRDKALCYLAAAVLAAETTLSIAKVDALDHAYVLASGVIFALFIVFRRKR
jgi:hypothetical protein